MGKFLDDHLTRVAPELRKYCVQYAELKALVHALEEEAAAKVASGDDPAATLHGSVDAFTRRLEFEAGRAATAYDESLEHVVHKLKYVRRKWRFLSPDTLPPLYRELKETAQTLSDALVFVEVNAEAVSRILRAAEKKLVLPPKRAAARTGERAAEPLVPLSGRTLIRRDEFLRSRLRPDGSSALRRLKVHAGLRAVVEEIRRRLDGLRVCEAQWHRQGLLSAAAVRGLHGRRDTLPLLASLQRSAVTTARRTQWYAGLLAKAQVDFDREPIGKSDTAGIVLNNLNTFLYMANYYVVIPTANRYAEAVGLPAAFSGLFLAMTPLASLLASVVYSLWSNRSFKEPLLFCTVLLVVGNVCHLAAYDLQSPAVFFLGRLLVGLGGNRAVNRRYLADFVSVERRTFHSAVFVALGSLGMSLGPGCQYLFDLADFRILGLSVNAFTASGWLMTVCWAAFAAQVFLRFKEPVRLARAPEAGADAAGVFAPLLEAPPSFANSGLVIGCKRRGSAKESSIVIQSASGARNSVLAAAADADLGAGAGLASTAASSRAIYLLLWCYFVLKMAQEAFQAAAPMHTETTFGWTEADVGYLLAGIGLVVLPANFLLAWVSERIDDFTVIVVTLLVMAGCALFSASTASVAQYVRASAGLFVAAQLLEAVNMSVLSKVMPKKMSRGLWNSGFVSTEAGTLGRVLGSSLLTLVATVFSAHSKDLQLLVMVPCAALVAATAAQFIAERTCGVFRPATDDGAAAVKNEFEDVWARLPELTPLCVQLEEMQGKAAAAAAAAAAAPAPGAGLLRRFASAFVGSPPHVQTAPFDFRAEARERLRPKTEPV